jgi:hypothetical protein
LTIINALSARINSYMPEDVQNVLPVTGQSVVEMKTVMQPIDMIASSNIEGILTQIRFRINGTGEGVVATVDSILTRTEEKAAGIRSVIFRCRSTIDGVQKVFELKYEVDRCIVFV